MEEEAYRGEDEYPKPKMKAPERHWAWWFWRMVGYLIYMPARRAWRWFYQSRYENASESEPWRGGTYVYRFPISRRLKDWVQRTRNKRKFQPIRRFLYWIACEWGFDCRTCGWDDYHNEDYVIYGKDGDELRTIELFDFLEGGGTDYFGEANDCCGWLWCYRCGDRHWTSF